MPELLATVADLRDIGGETIAIRPAEAQLRLASGEVRAYCGHDFDRIDDDPIILDGSGTRTLVLPAPPVLDVAEVYDIRRAALLVADADYEWSAVGLLRTLGHRVFVDNFRAYRVTYSHGYDVVPDGVAAVVVRIALRTIANPAGLTGETIGRYSYTAAGGAEGVGLTRADEHELNPWLLGIAPQPVAAL